MVHCFLVFALRTLLKAVKSLKNLSKAKNSLPSWTAKWLKFKNGLMKTRKNPPMQKIACLPQRLKVSMGSWQIEGVGVTGLCLRLTPLVFRLRLTAFAQNLQLRQTKPLPKDFVAKLPSLNAICVEKTSFTRLKRKRLSSVHETKTLLRCLSRLKGTCVRTTFSLRPQKWTLRRLQNVSLTDKLLRLSRI